MPHLAPESEEMGGERDKSHTPSSNHGETAMQGTYVKINNGLYGTRWLLPTFIRPRSSEGGWFRVRTIEEAAKKSEGMQAISVACGHMRDEVERREGETPEELGKRIILTGLLQMASLRAPKPRLSRDPMAEDEERERGRSEWHL